MLTKYCVTDTSCVGHNSILSDARSCMYAAATLASHPQLHGSGGGIHGLGAPGQVGVPGQHGAPRQLSAPGRLDYSSRASSCSGHSEAAAHSGQLPCTPLSLRNLGDLTPTFETLMVRSEIRRQGLGLKVFALQGGLITAPGHLPAAATEKRFASMHLLMIQYRLRNHRDFD